MIIMCNYKGAVLPEILLFLLCLEGTYFSGDFLRHEGCSISDVNFQVQWTLYVRNLRHWHEKLVK